MVRAKKFYKMKDKGEKQPWSGRIFLNPPFKASITRGTRSQWTRTRRKEASAFKSGNS